MIGLKNSDAEKIKYTQITVPIVLLVFAGIFAYQSCSFGDGVGGHKFLNHQEDVAYVGIQKCAQCHQEQYKTFVHTGMGLSFDSAQKTKSSAHFHKNTVVFDSVNGFYYRPFWQNDELFVKEYKLAGKDTTHALVQKIDYIVGSGQHTNSHLFKQGNFIYQAPITFYTQEGKWDLPPGFENGNNARFSRAINSECMSCHNAMPIMKDASKYRFAQIGRGIDCERCHGPGELHVKKWENEQTKMTGTDNSIVNPGNLPMDLQIDVCQRCHLQGNNILQEGKKFTDFKPGMKLNQVFQIFLPEYQGENPKFNMANHAERMQKSACFISSQQTAQPMTCITCHNPHVSHKAMGKNYFNNKCLECHNPNSSLFSDEKLNHLASSNCIDCHMPTSEARDIPHVTVHDHWIQSRPQKSTTNSKMVGLKAINGGEVSSEKLILAYLTYYEKFDKNPFHLEKASNLLNTIDNTELLIHYQYLKENWAQIVELAQKIKPEKSKAWTAYRIGIAHQSLGNWVSSVVWLKNACRLEKDMPNFWLKLGNAQLQVSDLDGAQESYQKAQKINPMEAKVWNNLGIVAVRKSEMARAKSFFSKAIALDPNYLLAYKNLLKIAKQKKDIQWQMKIKEQMKKNHLSNEQISLN